MIKVVYKFEWIIRFICMEWSVFVLFMNYDKEKSTLLALI